MNSHVRLDITHVTSCRSSRRFGLDINTNHPDFIANNQAQLGMNSSEPIDSRTSSSHAAGQAHQENVGFFGKLFGGRKRSGTLLVVSSLASHGELRKLTHFPHYLPPHKKSPRRARTRPRARTRFAWTRYVATNPLLASLSPPSRLCCANRRATATCRDDDAGRHYTSRAGADPPDQYVVSAPPPRRHHAFRVPPPREFAVSLPPSLSALAEELLSSYFDIARKNIQDGVAKAIWHFLVNKGREDLHKALVTGLYQEQDLDRLLLESDATKVRRSQLQAELATLKRAKEIIQRYESSSSL